jgi:hypothetical protein
MEHHVFAVTDGAAGGELWHIALDTAEAFGDLDSQTGGRPPWSPRTIVDSACAVDSEGNLHVLVVTDNGQLWHTVRAQNGDWTPVPEVAGGRSWGEVGKHLQFTGGNFKAVAAYTKDRDLHVLAATDTKKVWHVIRKPRQGVAIHEGGQWVSPSGTPNKFFEEVKFLGQAKGRQFLTLVSV